MTRAANLAEAAGSGFAFRNRIINGDMRIDQRNAGAAVTANAGTAFSCDRWRAYLNGTGSVTMTQSATVPNANFTNSIVSTVTGVGTPSESAITQTIEGYNIADLGFGTGDAKALTASFWVRSSVTGTFCFSLRQGSGSRSFVSPFTISSANTWQQVVVSIPGDVTGTYNSTNGAGLIVEVCIGASTLITSTVNAWQAGNYVATSAQTNLASTNGATFYLTGVQLEKGSVATPFEFRPYGTELALCQRYYYKNINYGGGERFQIDCYVTTGVYPLSSVSHPVPMRATPTKTKIGSWNGSGINAASVGFGGNDLVINIQADASGTGRGYLYPLVNEGWSASAEL